MGEQWPLVPLNEVLKQDQEYIDNPEPKVYPKLSVKLYGKGVVLDAPADGSNLKMQRHQLAGAGQVVLSEIWGKKGAIGFVPPEGEGALCTSHFFLFDVITEIIDPRYLQAIFTANYLQDQLDAEAKGTTGYAAVRPKMLLAATIPLPPLAEQRRIVARIEQLASQIGEAQHLRQQAVEILEALVNAYYGKVFSDPRLSLYPCAKIGDVCKSRSGGTPSKSNPNFWQGTIPWISPKDMSEWLISDAIDHISEDAVISSSTEVVNAGTVLVVVRSGILVHTVPIAVTTKPAAFNQDIKAVIPDKSKLEPLYLARALRSQERNILTSGVKRGSTVHSIKSGFIESIEIPLPPLDEQRRIVAYLDDLQARVDSLKQLQAQTQAELDALLPSVLDKAFKGEL